MNFLNPHQEPLPLRLPVAYPNAPRHEIAGLMLGDAAMSNFNSQLHQVDERAPTVNSAQMLQLAHWLKSLPAETAEATINLRMAQAESLRRMLDDPDWSLPAGIVQRGRRLLDYIFKLDDLIPDDLPLFGHLDDALLVELSWSQFAGEIQDYLDYCRFCSGGTFRGSAGERRSAWESACLAEASAMLHSQNVNTRGYSRPTPLSRPFRVV